MSWRVTAARTLCVSCRGHTTLAGDPGQAPASVTFVDPSESACVPLGLSFKSQNAWGLTLIARSLPSPE